MPAVQFFRSGVFPPVFPRRREEHTFKCRKCIHFHCLRACGAHHPGRQPGMGDPRTQTGTACGTLRILRSLEHIKSAVIVRLGPNTS